MSGKSNFRNASKNAKGFFGKKRFDDDEFGGKKPFKKGFKGAKKRAMFGEEEGNPFAKGKK